MYVWVVGSKIFVRCTLPRKIRQRSCATVMSSYQPGPATGESGEHVLPVTEPGSEALTTRSKRLGPLVVVDSPFGICAAAVPHGVEHVVGQLAPGGGA